MHRCNRYHRNGAGCGIGCNIELCGGIFPDEPTGKVKFCAPVAKVLVIPASVKLPLVRIILEASGLPETVTELPSNRLYEPISSMPAKKLSVPVS